MWTVELPATFSMQIAIAVPKGWFSLLISVLSSTARASVRRKLLAFTANKMVLGFVGFLAAWTPLL
jgi:hypothetical protein